MADLVIGTSAYPNADIALLEKAGIGWVRHGFGHPFVDKVGGEVSERYRKAKATAQELRAKGLRIMGGTPGVGIARYDRAEDGTLKLRWRDGQPEWFGALGTSEYFDNYGAVCEWLANDLRGIVEAWQIGNELDWYQFRGPLNLAQVCDLITVSARALKAADPSLIVGTNTGGTDRAYFLYGRLFGTGEDLLDYCGVDHYYGTWSPGVPSDWEAEIEELYAITGAPILVSEWGFSSAGEGITEAERKAGGPVCQHKKWRLTWGPGHTPEGQARFIEEAFDAFCRQRDAMMGLFFFRWEDQENCWQCGEPDCPAETAWGLVDLEGKPKPSYETFRKGVERLVAV